MRNKLSYLSILVSIILCNTAFVACSGGGDDKDEPEVLSVNPNSISLVATANSSGTFLITASGDWIITGGEEWLNISSSSGTGNTTVIVTALSDNSSASNRNCTLIVQGSSTSATINVVQLAGLQSGCEVTMVDEVVLADSYAQKLKFGPNVSYFYAGWLSSSSAGWTDDRIVQELQSSADAIEAEDGIILSADNLYENTQYYQYYVGFDKQGKRGEVLRCSVQTPSSKNAPAAYISNVTYSSTLWKWTTTISATASEYYMLSSDGSTALYYYYLYSPAEIAMYIKDNISNFTSYIQSSSWSMSRDADNIFIATWAKKNNEWSGIVTEFYGEINSSNSSPMLSKPKSDPTEAATIVTHRQKEYDALRQNSKIIRL